MEILSYIILSTILISLISFFGVLTLVLKEKILSKITTLLVAFAAGSLMGGAFLHLIPEAVEEIGNEIYVYESIILGFSLFFFLEGILEWHHCHKMPSEHRKKPVGYLILISDAIHNFLDGLAISASYIASLETGIAATISCIFHEIPQELGDFGVLISSGWTKKKALLYNFFSGLTCVLGGVIAYFFSSRMNISFLLPLTAGNFIYIATSDLIPEIKKHENLSKNLIHFVFFILGILLMLLIKE